ncbi:hypothetical protein LTR95_010017 [Oleoguttula sp. CCFEE 5521]
MLFTQAIASAILLFAATGLTAPVPQLAGEGAAANSILSGTDNAVGYGVEDAEDNLAGNVATAKAAVPAVPRMFTRQLAGEGAAADSILSGTDNAVGHGVEDAEDNVAADITSAKGGSTTTGGGSNPLPPPPPPNRRRQLAGEGAAANSILSGTDNAIGYGTEDAEDNLAGNVATVKAAVTATKRQLDKVAAGAQAVSDAAGTGDSTSAATTAAEADDGSLTSGAANAGQTVADIEVATAEGAGKSVPKSRRQLDKIANGAQAIGDAAGVGSTTAPATSAGDSVDGTLTSGAANAGAQVADTEVSTAESVGKSVPRRSRA